MQQTMQTMFKFIPLLLIVAVLAMSCRKTDDSNPESQTNKISSDRMLLVLSAPSVDDEYYEATFDAIISFQIAYANAIIGNDNVVVLADAQTMTYLEGKLPNDVLLEAEVYDIWMRDFTTVNPLNPVQFEYTWASMTKSESQEVQGSFDQFSEELGLNRGRTTYLIDGGNIVDNYAGRIITTTRFLEDNNLTKEEGKHLLRNLLNATEVAILPPDDEVLAHSDGMVSWLDANTLMVNDYSDDPDLRTEVLDELAAAFPGVTPIEVPVEYSTAAPASGDGIGSACGINLNATVTFDYAYVPVFGMSHDEQALQLIRDNSGKTIIPINAQGVCELGGSVRCLTWQLSGGNAETIINAARDK